MTWFRRVRDSFWFLPAILCVAALVFAQLMIWVDRLVDQNAAGFLDFLLFQVGASGGRDILGAIGGSMLAVAATSFSVTIMVLATASATYGPRLVRNFMIDRRNQFVLGIFGATFLYSLMVLRTIRSVDSPGGGFVPDISVNLAVFFAIVDVAVLVYFIHHIADSIQVATLSNRVRVELVSVVNRVRPRKSPSNAVQDAKAPAGPCRTVFSKGTGFVQTIDRENLLGLSTRNGLVVELLVVPGDHMIAEEPMAHVWQDKPDDTILEDVRHCIALGNDRSPEQDVGYAIQQLTEMAVRALSPSMNDPFTAHNALQEIAVGLVPFCERPDPGNGRVDDDGVLRVIARQTGPIELIDFVFDAVRSYALSHPSVLLASLVLAERVGRRPVSAETVAALLNQITLMTNAFRATDPPSYDLDRVMSRAEEVGAVIREAQVDNRDSSDSGTTQA
ncbi:DUF2254 domain-containing protein [Arthrobacter sp. H14]|uniref:DUF2254 domain-containing protein n=1 Tax=Arthrobacter sp. H14 TaxID=1312959 RepID=UPI0004B1E978|nr:DUF2254 domain-containing protein [Arthrobacter sp. H14]